MSPARPLHQPEAQPHDLAVNPRDVSADSGAAPLFSHQSEVRLLIDLLIGHPVFRVTLMTDRTLVCVDGHDWWAFGKCGHALGIFHNERHAAEHVCAVCEQLVLAERFAGLFVNVVRHAASVAPDRSQPSYNKVAGAL